MRLKNLDFQGLTSSNKVGEGLASINAFGVLRGRVLGFLATVRREIRVGDVGVRKTNMTWP